MPIFLFDLIQNDMIALSYTSPGRYHPPGQIFARLHFPWAPKGLSALRTFQFQITICQGRIEVADRVRGNVNQPRKREYSQQDKKVDHMQLDHPRQRGNQADLRLKDRHGPASRA